MFLSIFVSLADRDLLGSYSKFPQIILKNFIDLIRVAYTDWNPVPDLKAIENVQ